MNSRNKRFASCAAVQLGKWMFAVVMASAASLSITPTQAATSDAWPTKPIRMLVGFGAGGPTDVVARIVAQKMSEELGQPIVIENRGGAGGNIAVAALLQAPADGYTLLYNTSSITIAPWVYASVGFDPIKDFTPVGSTASVPLLLITNPKVDARTPKELVELIKKNPGKLNYASSGTGAIEHLTAAQLLSQVGGQATHVPYTGTAPAQVDLIAGATQFTTTTLNTALAMVKKGDLRALAVTSAQRSPTLPDVPTIGESLLPGFVSEAWQGIVAPKDTPPQVVARLNKAINAALESAGVREKLLAQGTTVLGGTSEQYAAKIQAEYTRWKDVVALSGARAQ